jgi:hypothetical protein
MRLKTAMAENRKNKVLLFQQTNADSRHSMATCDFGSKDQSNTLSIVPQSRVSSQLFARKKAGFGLPE